MNRLAAEILSPSEFPTDLVTLQNSDAIILSNVSADELSNPSDGAHRKLRSRSGEGIGRNWRGTALSAGAGITTHR